VELSLLIASGAGGLGVAEGTVCARGSGRIRRRIFRRRFGAALWGVRAIGFDDQRSLGGCRLHRGRTGDDGNIGQGTSGSRRIFAETISGHEEDGAHHGQTEEQAEQAAGAQGDFSFSFGHNLYGCSLLEPEASE
jgi:hypothetical protein